MARGVDTAAVGVPAKLRLDALLVARGLAETRARAHALVMAGRVFSGETRLDKPGKSMDRDAALSLRGRDHDWASRGGLKLAHALDFFALDPQDRVALDLGASTGGFTDVLLRRGAAKVFAVDVGYGQLDWRLRNDRRVVVMERTNARTLKPESIPDPPEAITCDASFIGLATILPASLALAAPGAWLIALIKPQFEVGKGRVGRTGVVRDTALHAEVCARIQGWLAGQPGWTVLGIRESPISGPAGNKEFLIAAKLARGPDAGGGE